jgi:hypothetical protein
MSERVITSAFEADIDPWVSNGGVSLELLPPSDITALARKKSAEEFVENFCATWR